MSPFPPYQPPPPAPKIGDVVHYVAAGDDKHPPTCRPAFVTEVDAGDPYLIGVAAFWPIGFYAVPLSAGGVEVNFVDHRDAGSWHWPAPGVAAAILPPANWEPE